MMRVGIIGAGAAAERIHVPGLLNARAELVGFASRTRASAERLQLAAGTGAVFDTADALIAAVDAVVIATPHAAHAVYTLAALRAGRAVLVEKPIAESLPDADDMVAAAISNGQVLAVAHTARFDPAVEGIRRNMSHIGPVTGFRFALRNRGPKVWSPSAAWSEQRPGGVLLDLGVHCSDLAAYLLGGVDEVVHLDVDDVDVPRTAQLRVRIGDVVGAIDVSWDARAHRVEIRIDGADGCLDYATVDPVPPPRTLHESFLDACAGRPFGALASGEDGRGALAVCLAAFAFAREF